LSSSLPTARLRERFERPDCNVPPLAEKQRKHCTGRHESRKEKLESDSSHFTQRDFFLFTSLLENRFRRRLQINMTVVFIGAYFVALVLKSLALSTYFLFVRVCQQRAHN
jgi:hypothetical protein